MIGLELKGRLGNQMFRYAYARALIHSRGERDTLLLGLEDFKNADSSQGWENALKYFNIINYTESSDKLVNLSKSTYLSFLSRSFYFLGKLSSPISRNCQLKIQASMYPMMAKHGLYYSFDNQYVFPDYRLDNIYIDGSFENIKYFNHIREILLKEFSPIMPEIEQNRDLYKLIRETNSVCISIRRGDYLSSNYSSLHSVCTQQYYRNAINWCKTNMDNPVFVFFSDDMDWVRSVFGDENAYYESGIDPVWEKLRLMYSCKHFIISNSSFSWWAQYLSRHEDKIVLSPTRWYNDNRPAFLLDDSFIKIES